MADITRAPFARHLRGSATTWVRHARRGAVAHEGREQSFWFRPLSAVLSEVPVDDRELPLLFHARTLDFQDVTVQATVTYRIEAPELAADRLDFGLDPETGRWRADPLAQLAALLTESAQQHALEVLARLPLTTALATGVAAVREAVTAGLLADPRIAGTGLRLVDARVVAVRPEPEVERALQTPAREQVQQEADKATYERRAVAVERERAIAENEMANQIALARREEELVVQRGGNARRQAEEAAAAGAVEARAKLERDQLAARGQAAATREVGAARAEAEGARLQVYAALPDGVLAGLALKELAGNLPQVQSLVLTPDLLAPVLAKLGLGAGGDR
jgi:hypothetical protein